MAARSLGGRDQALTVGERGRHWLFQQDVLAGLERLDGHVDMQMIGPDDVDQIDAGICEQGIERAMDRHAGQVVRRLPGRGVVARDHTAERKSLDAPDRARMHAAPAAISHQTDTHALPRPEGLIPRSRA